METRPTLQLVQMGPDRRIGTELGGYRIVEPLGRGGPSVVYRAQPGRPGRAAAPQPPAPALRAAGFPAPVLPGSKLPAPPRPPPLLPVHPARAEGGALLPALA